MSDVKAELDELFNLLDVEKALKKICYRGFASYEEYLKYGDLFESLRIDEKSLDRQEGIN